MIRFSNGYCRGKRKLEMIPPGSRRSKIRPPRKSLVGSTAGSPGGEAVDFDKSWAVLSNAIKQIQNKNVSNLSYEQLYRKAYVLVLRKFGGRLYDNVKQLIIDHLLVRRADLLRHSETNEDFIKNVLREWDDNLQSTKFVSDILMYLNRVYVRESKKLLIQDLGIQIFKDYVVKYNDHEVGNRLTSIILAEITRSRKGEVITSKQYIKNIIQVFESMVESDGIGSAEDENYYQKHFEPQFLDNSSNFFHSFSQELLVSGSLSMFTNDVSHFLKEEEDRIKFYLPSSTLPKLVNNMNNIMIRDKIDQVLGFPKDQQGFSFLLDPVVSSIFQNGIEISHIRELKNLYRLIHRIDPEIEPLKRKLRDLIILQGNMIPSMVKEKISLGGGNTKKSVNTTSFAVQWIDAVLKYEENLIELIKQGFYNNSSLLQTSSIAIQQFVSGNPGTSKNVSGVNAPEMLSIYIDHHIKSISKTYGGRDVSNSAIDSKYLTKNAIHFLNFVKDKAAFEAHYANHFAKRFLNSKSSVDDSAKFDIEDMMISRLGGEMVAVPLEKIIKMNKDMRSSRSLTKEWKNNNDRSLAKAEMELKICNAAEWPKSMTKDYMSYSNKEDNKSGFIWPKQLRQTMRDFEEYWFNIKKNNNKSLFWSPKFGSMDLRITYPSKTYEINVSTYAGTIMLLFAPQSTKPDGSYVSAFDENRELTYTEIKELTGIPESDLKRQLQSIAVAPRSRLLIKTPLTKEVNESDVFSLNPNFKSPSTKVKVLTVSASSSTKPSSDGSQKTDYDNEMKEVNKSISIGHKVEVNAAIVRIMKSRHTIDHNALIGELLKQLADRFQPSTILIKQSIEELIEKEYIKRDNENKSTYHYIA